MVRQLKKDGGSAEDIEAAVKGLQKLKISSETLSKQNSGADGDREPFNRKVFDELLVRKMFVVPSFEIHGGVKGLYDLGPPACGLKAAMLDLWRKHFVLAESMLEMECTCLTPEVVLKTSGHVERFTDLMVKDVDTSECFRADKLLEDAIDVHLEKHAASLTSDEKEAHLRVQRQADAFTPTEIDAYLLEYKCVAPSSGKPFSPSFPFNLMFPTSIGPEGTSVGYLRPETAQGLFVNFRRLLDANAQKMPFAAAQIGLGFRNEIAPRAGLLRVREFTMGEIEHFVNPDDKSHANFASVANKELVLFGNVNQLGNGKTTKMSIGEAVKTGLVNNETLGYFMARTQLFLEKIGMDPERLRFRQHLTTEMAHYATDCWDLEIQSSYGWIECVGHADRACFDLDVHSKVTKTPMLATQKLDKPQQKQVAGKLKLNRKLLGQAFKQDQRIVSALIEEVAEDWTAFQEQLIKPLEETGSTTLDNFTITKDMILSYKETTKTVHEIKFTPSVIEPSFGMGRILYSLLEHSFYQRKADEQRIVMKFNPTIAPTKCAVLPISSSVEMNLVVNEIATDLMESDLSTRVDTSSAALGRRYARSDEIGVPFAVTVDFGTLENGTVTLRERDSTHQVRLPKSDVTQLIFKFCHGKMTWDQATEQYPLVQVNEDGEAVDAPPTTTAATTVEKTSRGTFARPAPGTLPSK
eukprot:scaffold31936_cov43-Attheya_sp.AAC.1